MKVYLVINNSKANLITYEEQYQVFSDSDKALTHAKSIGYQDPFGMGINEAIGMLNAYAAGDINVCIMPIKIK